MAVENYYQIIGRKGGETTKKRYGKGGFKLIGKMGGRPKKRRLTESKQEDTIKK